MEQEHKDITDRQIYETSIGLMCMSKTEYAMYQEEMEKRVGNLHIYVDADACPVVRIVEKIAENLEGLVCAIGCDSMPSDGAIYVDGEQKVNYISTREALRILDGFGNNSASVMIGKSDYILIYDASRKLVIDGEAYLPSGYLVMKSCNGLQAIDDEDIADVIAALKSRMTMLALGKYRIQAYQLG